jgi:hypothetical protein
LFLIVLSLNSEFGTLPLETVFQIASYCLHLRPGPVMDLRFPHSSDYRCVPPHFVYLLRLGFVNFSPRLALNHDLPNLCFPNS